MKEEPCECSEDDNWMCDWCLKRALMFFDFNATEEDLQTLQKEEAQEFINANQKDA